MSEFDSRITPARPDLAAAHLEGKIAAGKFAAGHVLRAARGCVDLRRGPRDDAGLETQLLYGEAFTIYEEKDGWAWGQAGLDSYVGYARIDSFLDAAAPTHRVTALATPLLPAPDVKKPARDMLPMNAKLGVAESGERFMRLTNGLYVFANHLAPIAAPAPDWVAVAERFLGVPYLWGGKTFAGVDCSGLIQTALEAGGVRAPRDTDMMESALGTALVQDAGLKRGDLIFWKGHMGAMCDGARLIHANAHFMQVTIEPLGQARARIEAAEGLAIRSIKRLP